MSDFRRFCCGFTGFLTGHYIARLSGFSQPNPPINALLAGVFFGCLVVAIWGERRATLNSRTGDE